MTADSPGAAVREARVALMTKEDPELPVTILIAIANEYLGNVAPLSNEAKIIYEGLKVKSLNQAEAARKLRELDARKGAFLGQEVAKLRAWDQRNWPRWEAFLSRTVRPAITAETNGCTHGQSFSAWADETFVYATAAMTLSYLCVGELTTTITAPDSKQISTAAAASGASVVSAFYAMGDQDGNYFGNATYSYDGSDVGLGAGTFPSQSSNTIIPPFVQIVDSVISAPTLGKSGASTTFNSIVITSTHCSGPVTAGAAISHPNSMDISIASPSSNGTTRNDSASGHYNFDLGQSHEFQYRITIGARNASIGEGIASAHINSYPSGCTVFEPRKGHSPAQSFRVE